MQVDDSSPMQSIFIAAMSLEELGQLFACDIEGDDDFYDVLAYNIVQLDPDYLLDRLPDLKGPRLRGAVFGLGCSPSPGQRLRSALLELLDLDELLVVAEAIDALKTAGYLDLWGRVSALRTSRSEHVRGALLRYARRALSPPSALDVLIEAAEQDSSPIVLQNALDELGELGAQEAVRVVQGFLDHDDEAVRESAAQALRQILT